MSLSGRDIVAIDDLSVEEIYSILDKAEEMIPIARGERTSKLLGGNILASLFFEPSTRTRLSFETAMHRLGGDVITIAGSEGTSLIKGETLADTVRMAEAYSDVIAMRHPREGAARLSATFSSVPIINGGDGAGQHPTQTLLDLFTMRAEVGDISKLHVTIIGDLRHGRTVHSLSRALGRLGAEMTFVAPDSIQMPEDILKDLTALDAPFKLSSELSEHIPGTDVLYVTRIQKERFVEEEEYLKVAGTYRVDPDVIKEAKKSMIVLHPLPRVDEIDPLIDSTPHAKYFIQAFNGVPIRMALLSLVLEGER